MYAYSGILKLSEYFFYINYFCKCVTLSYLEYFCEERKNCFKLA